MKNRKLPFGYEMQRGRICIANPEAELVKQIFKSYQAGNSYDTLADWLNNSKVPYVPGKAWNKNVIARILQDERYLGTEIYPQIIEESAFERRAPPVSGKLTHPQVKGIRLLAHCPLCGSAIRRERKELWRCQCWSAPAKRTSDTQLIDAAAGLLQELHEHPDMVRNPASDNVESPDILIAQNRLTLELERTEFDESAAKSSALALAAARLNAIGSEDYETTRIQYILTKTEQSGALNTDLLRQITSAILIHPNGAVSLKLKNGQIIERTDLT